MASPFPMTPFIQALNLDAIDNLITWAGQNVLWMKSHSCPCVGDTGSSGSFNQHCTTCFGRGFYWDPTQGPFIVLLTLISWIGRNVDIGDTVDPTYGMVLDGHPILTIPSTLTTLWPQVNTRDIFVQRDSTMRFQATMRVGENTIVPAWHILDSITIAPSGAVIVEDPVTNQPVSGVPYTVNGGTVTLNPNLKYPTGYPTGTSYTVEYFSPVAWVIEEPYGGLAHTRPFGQGIAYPRRWKTTGLDLWLRSRIGLSTNITPGP
jgi:hypothetical protein